MKMALNKYLTKLTRLKRANTVYPSGLSLPKGDLNLYYENQDFVRLATNKSSTISKKFVPTFSPSGLSLQD